MKSLIEVGPFPLAAFTIVGQTNCLSLMVSLPGWAKTAIVQSIARKTDRYFFPYHGDQGIPEDLGGFRYLGEWKPCDDMPGLPVMKTTPDERFVKAQVLPSVLFFDELLCCPPDVQAAMLQIACDPPACCWPYAAGNDPQDGANGHPLTMPMINRLWMGKMEFDWECWESGMVNNGNFPLRELPILPDEWMASFNKWGSRVIAMRQEHPDAVGSPQRNSSKKWDGKPFPSARSWHNACKALAACDSVGGKSDVRTEILKGFVGEAAAGQFWSFLASTKLPSSEELLNASQEERRKALKGFNGAQLLIVAHSVVGDTTARRSLLDEEEYVGLWEECQNVLVAMSEVGHEEVAQLTYNGMFRVITPGKEAITYPSLRGYVQPCTVLDRNRAETATYLHSAK